MLPTIGRIVLYTMDQEDCNVINGMRAGDVSFRGNNVHAGQTYPAMVVSVNGPTSVNLQVFLDGTDCHWAPSRAQDIYADVDDEPEWGCWKWPYIPPVDDYEELHAIS